MSQKIWIAALFFVTACSSKPRGQDFADSCVAEAVKAAGFKQAAAGAPDGFPSERYQDCKGHGGALRKAYADGYREGRVKFCQGDDAEERGFREGNSGLAKGGIHGKFGICTPEQRRNIEQYELIGYQRGLAQFCGATNLETEAERDARESDEPRFPEKFAVCASQVKDIETRYRDEFIERRKRVVSSMCSYERGLERGLNDGVAGRKDTAMPAFCAPSLFGPYLQGYNEGFDQAKGKTN